MGSCGGVQVDGEEDKKNENFYTIATEQGDKTQKSKQITRKIDVKDYGRCSTDPEKNEMEETKLEIENIEEEENKIIQSFQNIEEKKINLEKFSQYSINPEKNKVNFSYSNQMIITFKKNVNPFKEKIEQMKEIIEIKSKVQNIQNKYKNEQIVIKPMNEKFRLGVTQIIEHDYDFQFKLKNIENGKEKTFIFNDEKAPFLFIIFDIKSSETIEKIKEIKKYKEEVKDNEDKKFIMILIIKDYNTSIKEKIKSNELDNCYCFLDSESESNNINLLLGSYEEFDSKCILIDRSSIISLILENDIDFLTKDTINYYLEYNTKKNFNCYGEDDKYSLKEDFENNDFKKYLEKLKQKYNLKIEFKEIGTENETKKYPLIIRFEYHQDDEKYAEDILRHLEDKINNLGIKYKHLIIKKIKQNNNQINDDKNGLIQSHRKVNELKNENIELKSENTKLKNENTELKKENTELKKENIELKNKNTELKKENSELKKENKELNNENTKLKNENTELKKENKELKNENTELKNKLNIIFKTKDDSINKCIKCYGTDKLSDIKKRILDTYPENGIDYIFKRGNETLKESETLNHYNIKDNDVIDIYSLNN